MRWMDWADSGPRAGARPGSLFLGAPFSVQGEEFGEAEPDEVEEVAEEGAVDFDEAYAVAAAVVGGDADVFDVNDLAADGVDLGGERQVDGDFVAEAEFGVGDDFGFEEGAAGADVHEDGVVDAAVGVVDVDGEVDGNAREFAHAEAVESVDADEEEAVLDVVGCGADLGVEAGEAAGDVEIEPAPGGAADEAAFEESDVDGFAGVGFDFDGHAVGAGGEVSAASFLQSRVSHDGEACSIFPGRFPSFGRGKHTLSHRASGENRRAAEDWRPFNEYTADNAPRRTDEKDDRHR